MTTSSNNFRHRQHLAAWLATRVSFALVVAATPFAAVQTTHAGEMRTWSSASGAHKTEAEFIELKDDGNVELKTRTGKLGPGQEEWLAAWAAFAVAVGDAAAADRLRWHDAPEVSVNLWRPEDFDDVHLVLGRGQERRHDMDPPALSSPPEDRT